MIEDYEPMDRRPDDFCERFTGQRIKTINRPSQSGLKDLLPFPIEPLPTAPVSLPQKRVSRSVVLAVTLELTLLMSYPP